MKKHLIALAVALSFTSPALAADNIHSVQIMSDISSPYDSSADVHRICFAARDAQVYKDPQQLHLTKASICSELDQADLVIDAASCEVIEMKRMPRILYLNPTSCTTEQTAAIEPTAPPARGQVLAILRVSNR